MPHTPESTDETFQGELPPELDGDEKLSDLTPDTLREEYLPGLVLKGPNGKPFKDSFYARKIKVAIDKFEKYTHIFLNPTVISDEKHDYIAADYIQWAWFQLYNYPIQSVREVIAEYPTGQTITIFPPEWTRIRKEHGQLQLVPTTGTLSNILIGRGGSYLGLLRYRLSYLPDLFKITYTAGLEHGHIPASIMDAVAKLAVIEVLNDLGDSIYGPGVTSLNIAVDGLSQGIGLNNAGPHGVFAARIGAYKRDLYGDPDVPNAKGIMEHIRGIFRGPTIVSA